MEHTLPPGIKQGRRARLLPVVADSSKEARVTSIVLAMLPRVPGLAASLLGSMGVRVGRRARLEAFTEVTFSKGEARVGRDRPDGLLVVDTGRGKYSILVEVKVGKASIELDQVCRYLDLARDNGIDAVLTISNQFVARADHPPIAVPKQALKNVQLFHWPWMWVLTQCRLLQVDGSIDDAEQRFMLDELVRYLEHDSTGVEGFTQMARGWKDVVRSVGAGATLQKRAPEVEQTVASWIQEERDLCLLLSRTLGQPVKQPIERSLRDDPLARLAHAIERFVETNALETKLRVPDAAGDIAIRADLLRKAISIGMRVRAPEDRKSTKARVNWLLRMIKTDDSRVDIRANWPSKVPPTQHHIAKVRENPDCLQASNSGLVPGSFDIVFVEELGARFSGSKTFIEELERAVPTFYELVGQHLREWRAAPPKPMEKPRDVLPEIVDVNRLPEDDTSMQPSKSEPVASTPDTDAQDVVDAEDSDEVVYALYVPPIEDEKPEGRSDVGQEDAT